ncbi:MAG TPA: mobile mystery protein A [bacterium]|nr:mobile mystery protein A [bacterium]
MRHNKKSTVLQRQLLDQKFKDLPNLPPKPQGGWLKADRVALGLSIRQLAKRLKVSLKAIDSIEKNEALGTATLNSIARSAKAMGCRLVYAVVPEEGADSLESILDKRALALARRIRNQTAHSMRLEDQAVESSIASKRENDLAAELKAKQDPRLWEEP